MPAFDRSPPEISTRLILCERGGEWAGGLRKALPDGGAWIVETRGPDSLEAEFERHPTSIGGLALTVENVQRSLPAIQRIADRFPRSHIVALLPRPLPLLAAAAREAGAVDVIATRNNLEHFIRLWTRHCRRHPPGELTILDQIIADLPLAD